MTIDLHRHLWSIFERYAAVREIAARGLVGGVHQHSEAPVQDVGSRAAEIRAEMDKTGVDRSCLLLGDYGLRLGEGDLSIEAENRLATDLAREDPEHFIAFFGIDPRRPGAVELFRDALDAGARGLKLHPCSGYSPSDPVCRPLYALAGERLHTWVETFRRLPEIAERHGVEVTPDEVDQMLGTTSASLMGLA